MVGCRLWMHVREESVIQNGYTELEHEAVERIDVGVQGERISIAESIGGEYIFELAKQL